VIYHLICPEHYKSIWWSWM